MIGLAAMACCLIVAESSRGSELRRTPIVRAVEAARPSVVNIHGEKTVTATAAQADLGDAGRRVNGMGTGVVIDPRGYIMTNYHVVDGVRQIKVTTGDGEELTARLVSRDVETDLAVIKIDGGKTLPMIPLGTSADLMPGETVLAVGNAYGYEHTVTQGIISALHRAVQVSDAQYYDDLIQTDASINPGNSGGPLLNIDGEMIGINVAVRAGAQGIGFAIPADKALAVAAKMLASNEVTKAWHGVVLADRAGVSDDGLAVTSVDRKSPAELGGLQNGDVITAVRDADIRRNLDFCRAMLDAKEGDKIEMTVMRSREPVTLELTLAARPDRPQWTASAGWEVLGLELEPIAAKTFREKYRTRYRGGLTVMAVRPNSPAETQGIRPGDVLVGMHIWETVSLENVSYILKLPDFAGLNPVKFFILRGDETLYGYLPVGVTTARRP